MQMPILQKVREIDRLDPVIHAQGRLQILTLLHEMGTLDCLNLTQLTGQSWGNLSTHLSKLEKAGYVTITKTFRGKKPQTFAAISASGSQAYLAWSRSMLLLLPAEVTSRMDRALPLSSPEQKPQWRDNNYQPLREIFFLPHYHIWRNELPPIMEYMQLS